MLDSLADIFTTSLPPAAVATFRKGGYYSIAINSKLKLITLNSLYYARAAPLNYGADPAGQFAWFSDEMASAAAKGQR